MMTNRMRGGDDEIDRSAALRRETRSGARLIPVAVALTVLLAATAVPAAILVPSSFTRSVMVSGDPGGTNQSSDGALGVFVGVAANPTLGTVRQTSDVAASGIVANGETNTASSGLQSSASLLDVGFTVDESGLWALSGVFSGDAITSLTLAEATASGGAVLAAFEHAPGAPPISFDVEISLLLGTNYVLSFSQTNTVASSGAYDFDLTFVPEPGSAILMGLGLALLARPSRRSGPT